MTSPSPPHETPLTQMPRRDRILKIVREWSLFLVIGAILFHLIGLWRAPDLPAQAPSFELNDLDGQSVRLESFRGRPVVLNFWATWCGPCRLEIPSFSSFARANPEVAVLGVAVDGTIDGLRKAVGELGIDYQVLRGQASTQRAYGVTTLPTTVIIDRSGEIISAHAGMMFRPQLEWALKDD